MDLLKHICPDSPYVWDGKGVSECFSDIVLVFGANVATLVVIAVVGVTKRRVKENIKINLPFKVLLYVLPVIGACTAFFDMVLLLRSLRQGHAVVFHRWLFSCSQIAVWVTVLLFSTRGYWFVFCNQVLSLWWIVKPFLLIPHLQTVFSSQGAFRCLRESSLALLDIMFGILINIMRIKWASYRGRSNSMEEPLLPCKIDVKEGHPKFPGLMCNFWHLITFKTIDTLMACGVERQLDSNDLLSLPEDLNPSSCHHILQQCWEAQQRKNSSHLSLLKAICCAYGWPYFHLGFLKVINDCLGFVGPVLLNKLIRFLQQGSDHYDGYIFAISLGLASILKSFLDTQYTFHLSKLKLKLRSSIMTIIYHKCLHVRLAERSKFSEGEIQTFMSVDADRTVNLCNSFHDIWSLPLQIGIALYLLYVQVKFAFLSGIAITILLIPVNKWIAQLIAKATRSMMEQKDERIRRTAELFTYIRTLKMYSWELIFASWLMKTRALEVKYLSTRKYLDAWCVFFWATTPTLFSLFTFGLYTLMGHQLDAATVFTCLALFNNLISPLNSFPWVINGLIDAFISSRRLSKYLSSSECELGMEKKGYPSPENMAVIICDACSTWSSSDEKDLSLILDNVTLQIPKGYLVAVIGEVGSGKSSVLNLILGEMRLVIGSIHLNGSTTYVPQIPWILSGTIRDNILFGRNYNSTRYSDVLHACTLDVDISLMIGGDMACIGEKGINLSGGQRARLALARALYCASDIYMLDDVLSAVDAHVACSILHNAILGPLMNQQTRILCTHNIQAIYAADMVVEMDKGRVKWVGTPSDLKVSSYLAFPSIENCSISSEVQVEERSSISVEAEGGVEVDNSYNLEGGQGTTDAETRKEGRVELLVYKNYAEFAGWFITILTCLSALLMQFSRNGNDLWLSYWVDTTGSSQKDYSTTFYLGMLCMFCLVNSTLTLVRAFSFAFGGIHAAIQVHDRLLNKLINASISFFDQTPSGRILNRFSSDLYTIDDSLPFIFNILLANFVGLLGIAIILSYVQVIFLLVLLPFWYIYSKLQFYYRSTSRELRRLDSVSRSPIYASFTETLDGASTIRAFSSEDFFFLRFIEHITVYQRTSYSEVTASLWLSLRLQLLAAFIVSFVAVMSVVGSQRLLPITLGTPGLVGLALSYAAPIVSLLGSFLTSFTETEKEMVSVERVLQYMDIPQEVVRDEQLYLNWPSQGEIQFQNVTLRYMPSLPPALRGVSFIITGGTQVGVIGRTGAGKSSILNALFRLNPISGGCILVDGINIAEISLRDLRSHLAVVPQSPFLFEGSLRDNLDPLHISDDRMIWNILEKCHVKQEVEAGGGLDMHVKESGISFSVGQRQLLCLARALLKSSQVLCLDECTANIDTQTSAKLQNAIASECRGLTVITIAHRISTVMNMDNILILDQGILVEQGNPNSLLNDDLSRFSSFAKASKM
ncbi:ABC transporter C family member 13 isoform X1 [Coffea eugenioides]|uniref:ABC transporter C family member 13 isoform X1 n=1 Tax=Coffea eugenioides TaxID=49369 RepID=UPI000F60D78E|nr:ABC transporter C family member 13 isoform X1 [Coffea eugenioides]